MSEEAVETTETPAPVTPEPPPEELKDTPAAWFESRLKARGESLHDEADEDEETPPEAAEEPAEAAPEEEPEEEKEPTGRDWVELKKQRDAAFKMQRTAEKRHRELEQRERQLLELDRLKQEQPVEFLKRLGLSARDLAELVVKESEETPEMKREREYQERLDRLERENAAAREAREQAQRQTAWSSDYTLLHDTLTKNSEEFRYINADGPQDAARLVTNLVHDHYYKTGEVLDYRELLGQYEADLKNRHERLARAHSSGERPEAPNGASPSRPGPKGKKSEAATQPGTLSNRSTSEVQSSVDPPEESRDQRIARLAKRIKFLDT